MNKKKLKGYLDKGISQRKIAKAENTSQTNVRYWMRKYELQAVYNRKGHPHYCSKCGETDPEKFYGRKRSCCASCHNRYAVERTRRQKSKIVKRMGGACQNCGFDTWECSLQVHHLDPSKKDPNFSTFTSWKWQRIEKELEGCVLLCANCHAAVHSGHVEVADGVLAPS